MVSCLFLLGIAAVSCRPVPGDRGSATVFRYNEASGITSLDPAYAKDLPNIWPCNQLFNGLVQVGDSLQIEPCIARSWEISPDGSRYVFHLRGDVFFHDHPVFPGGRGRKVTSSDFVYSFNRIVQPGSTSPGAWVFNAVAMKEGRHSFEALDDSTFQVTLSGPFPPFLGILAMQYCSVVPQEIVDSLGTGFRKEPVGTGPFRFKMWKEGVKLVLVKNDRYFETERGKRLPYLDAVAVTFLADKQSAFLEFIKGNLDFMSGLDPSYKDELLTRSGQLNQKYEGRIKLETMPYLNTEYLGILVDPQADPDSPLKDPAFRKALNHGFDRRKMVYYLRNNIVKPGLQGMIPPGLGAHCGDTVFYEYDPELSRGLLEKAGYGKGKEIPAITLHTTADYTDLCKYIQHQWGEIGIPVRIEVDPAATLKELRAQSKAAFFRASWVADYPDEENYLSLFHSRNFSPNGPNYTHYSNTAYDSLYDLSQSTADASLRMDLYREMDRVVMEEAPVIILYYDQVLRFTRHGIDGLGINAMNLLSLKKTRKGT